MAFTSYDSIIAALGAGRGEDAFFSKDSITTTSGRWYSLWKSVGLPTAGATPATGAGAVPTNSTTGALKFSSAAGSNTKYMLSFGVGGPTAGVLMIYDRLVHTSGLSGTVTTAQTVNTTALTRSTDGVGVLCGLEVYTTLGATSVTATMSYTDQDGNTGNSGTITIPISAEAGSFLWPMSFASGDTGVKAVASVTLSATTGTAGNFGVTLFKPIGFVAYDATKYTERDMVLQLSNLPTLAASSCLAFSALATTTSLGLQFGMVKMGEG